MTEFKTVTDLHTSELNQLQTDIMMYCKGWAKVTNTPIPQAKIIKGMQCTKYNNVKSYTTLNAIKALLTKGFIRKAWSGNQNRTYYVMCRNI